MKSIGIDIVKIILRSSANNLMNKKQIINDLNVFPVPDGDTGTNMSLTFCNAVDMLKIDELDTIGGLLGGLAKTSLRCARGNSGVILSQIIRGFSKGVEKVDTEINCSDIAKGLVYAKETAYRAVMQVTEGTILTVLREMSEFASENYKNYDDVSEFMSAILEYGRTSLAKTQEMLETLKRAGVVDAGGAGLIAIVEGAVYAAVNDTVIECELTDVETVKTVSEEPTEIRYTYCTEFLINKTSADRSVNRFKAAISPKGDCMLVIDDDEIVKVHIHTDHPGFVIEEALKLGELTNLKIDNMRYQHNEIINTVSSSDVQNTENDDVMESEIAENPIVEQNEGKSVMNEVNEPKKKYGIVATVAGDGFKQIFMELGADITVEGGQTMNPSTEDLLSAVNSANAETVFVLPNNKNIIMAAEQVKNIADCRVEVIPSRNVAQGISALMGFAEESRTEDNIESMREMMQIVKYGQVTTAVRDVELENFSIKCGDIIGIADDEIIVVGDDINSTAMAYIEKIADKYTSLITVYYGADVEQSSAEELVKAIEEKYPSLDVVLSCGGQPVYYYGISIEE